MFNFNFYFVHQGNKEIIIILYSLFKDVLISSLNIPWIILANKNNGYRKPENKIKEPLNIRPDYEYVDIKYLLLVFLTKFFLLKYSISFI